jgi:hypothetical protein
MHACMHLVLWFSFFHDKRVYRITILKADTKMYNLFGYFLMLNDAGNFGGYLVLWFTLLCICFDSNLGHLL